MVKSEDYFEATSNQQKNDILVVLAFEIRDLLTELVPKKVESSSEKVLTPKEFKSGPRSRHKRKISQ